MKEKMCFSTESIAKSFWIKLMHNHRCSMKTFRSAGLYQITAIPLCILCYQYKWSFNTRKRKAWYQITSIFMSSNQNVHLICKNPLEFCSVWDDKSGSCSSSQSTLACNQARGRPAHNISCNHWRLSLIRRDSESHPVLFTFSGRTRKKTRCSKKFCCIRWSSHVDN
jgi:hypothetical protein